MQKNIENIVRGLHLDNSDSSEWFLPANFWVWEFTNIAPCTVSIFEDPLGYLKSEVRSRIKDTLPYKHWLDMLRNGISDPIVATEFEGTIKLWDGYHRLAIALIRKENIPMYLGKRKDS